jgi:hypothetical protein
MISTLHLRYRSSGGGQVRVFINGFLIINDLIGETVNSRLEPYVRPGLNVLLVITDPSRQTSVNAQVVLVSESGSDDGRLAQVTIPNPASPGATAQVQFNLPASTPDCLWTRLQAVRADDNLRAHGFLASLSARLSSGPDAEILSMLQTKHIEVGRALGLEKEAMDLGLLEGLKRRRALPSFRVELCTPTDLTLVWSPDRTLARSLRKNGTDAILLYIDGVASGFEVTLGMDREQWIVIR